MGVLGGGHSPETEHLTWDMKVAKGSAEGHMLQYATRICEGRLTVGTGYKLGGSVSKTEEDFGRKSVQESFASECSGEKSTAKVAEVSFTVDLLMTC